MWSKRKTYCIMVTLVCLASLLCHFALKKDVVYVELKDTIMVQKKETNFTYVKQRCYSTLDFSLFKPDIKHRFDDVQQKCSKFDNLGLVKRTFPKSVLPRILVNDDYRVLFCLIPKVSTTTWRRVFLRLSGKVQQSTVENLTNGEVYFKMHHAYTTLKDFDQAGIDYRLKNYTKVMFVRNPFERLLSAYRNKFLNTKQFQKIFGERIISLFRQNVTKLDRTDQSTITFLEFLKFVTTTSDKTIYGKNNPHWLSYWDSCHPCTVNYDYIGRFENLAEEANAIVHYLGAKSIVFPRRDLFYIASKTRDVLKTFYSTIPRSFILKILERYKYDFELFSYKFSTYLQS